MSKKAVIDIGSLKVKVSVFDARECELLSTDSYMTLLGKGISEQHHIVSDSLHKLEEALQVITSLLIAQDVKDIVIIGTEAIRKADNREEIQQLIARYLPHHQLEIIGQDKEAALFFTAVAHAFPNQQIAAMDIGGGSVQLIFGRYDSRQQKTNISRKYNLSTGTYKLQQQYSPSNEHISSLFPTAEKAVELAYSHIHDTAPLLVFGSTCMLDFIRASRIPVEQSSQHMKHPLHIQQAPLESLLAEVRELAPNSRDHYFPEGGHFMYGADYLLLNLLQAIKVVRPQKIYPTNLNSSYGLI